MSASDETMDYAKKNRRAISATACEDQYRLELARGASHIASTLSAESRVHAIAEVVDGFVLQYGENDLAVFLEVLANRLTLRGANEAAAAVAAAAQRTLKRRPAASRT
ncbi:hypothetical protein [Paraburkholderia acidipaludis]|uniref:hypothetical protein n=1 Tax=Paraburkholderia acidipaludis TaxID=660537 RepID=UPI001FE03854|nr:hypothetical protein [Paraburkholderia acidipaludis]